MVYKMEDFKEIDQMIEDKDLDPHFLEDRTSPIARFPANYEGLRLAITLFKSIEKKKNEEGKDIDKLLNSL